MSAFSHKQTHVAPQQQPHFFTSRYQWWETSTTPRTVDSVARRGSWKPVEWAEEKGQIEKSVGPFIDARMRERQVYCHREQFASSADKPTRAQAFRARMAMGKVFWPKGAPWVDDVYRVLMTFPTGKVDDDVDVCSLFGRMLAPVRVFDQAMVQGALSQDVKPFFGGTA